MTNLEALKYLYVKCGGKMTDVHEQIKADPVGDYTILAEVVSALGALLQDRVLPVVDSLTDNGKTLLVEGGVWAKAEPAPSTYVVAIDGNMKTDKTGGEIYDAIEAGKVIYLDFASLKTPASIAKSGTSWDVNTTTLQIQNDYVEYQRVQFTVASGESTNKTAAFTSKKLAYYTP